MALFIEPFYGGSHKQLIDLLVKECKEEGVESFLFTLPAKKWHWRARTSALYFSQTIPQNNSYSVIFSSSVLNLAELLALRPDLVSCRKILYFHENQLLYPVRKHQERDFQYGYNQIISSLAADFIVFNSAFNRDSFLQNIKSFLKLIPDHRPSGIAEILLPRSRVLYFPINVSESQLKKEKSLESTDNENIMPNTSVDNGRDTAEYNNEDVTKIVKSIVDDLIVKCECIDITVKTSCSILSKSSSGDHYVKPLHIVWPHRWEHDKNPELFFNTLFQLKKEGCQYLVSVLGESFSEIPDIFAKAKDELAAEIKHWGRLEKKIDYFNVLKEADIVVSTAKHEFFGVAMLEAVFLGCYPCCPKKLVYPEIFPEEYLYNTENQLLKRLRKYCRNPKIIRSHIMQKPVFLGRFKRQVYAADEKLTVRAPG